MAFPEDLLSDGEQALLIVRPHASEVVPPIVFLLAVVAGCGGGLLLLAGPSSDAVGFVAVFSGLVALGSVLIFLSRLLHSLYTRYAITNHRVIQRVGVLSQDNRDVPLSVIQDVRVRQGLVARLVGAGDLELQSAATRGHTVLRWVPDVQEVRRLLHQLVRDNQSDPAGPSAAAIPPVAPGGPPAGADIVAQLRQLSELHSVGHLTDSEFETAKQRLLGGPPQPGYAGEAESAR